MTTAERIAYHLMRVRNRAYAIAVADSVDAGQQCTEYYAMKKGQDAAFMECRRLLAECIDVIEWDAIKPALGEPPTIPAYAEPYAPPAPKDQACWCAAPSDGHRCPDCPVAGAGVVHGAAHRRMLEEIANGRHRGGKQHER